jgi:hypothetical protein
MRSRGMAAGTPQPTHVGRPLALQSLCTVGARRLERPKPTYVGRPLDLPSLCAIGARRPERPNLHT